MASLKELRDRWDKSPWKEIKEKVIQILKDSKAKGFKDRENVFSSTYRDLKSVFEEMLTPDEIQSKDFSEIDLRGINLEGEKFLGLLLKYVNFAGANLSNTDFGGSHFIWVDLRSADLNSANLWNTVFEGATLGNFESEDDFTDFSQADLRYTKFRDTIYSGIKYGYNPKEMIKEIRKKEYKKAEGSYRVLRKLFRNQGEYDKSGECYLEERKAKRKNYRLIRRAIDYLLFDLTCGYGERPRKYIASILVVILGSMVVYYFCKNQFIYSCSDLAKFSIWKALYFSIVTFTTLGFGDWHPNPNSLIKFWVAAEALLGAYLIALGIITFGRKMLRD